MAREKTKAWKYAIHLIMASTAAGANASLQPGDVVFQTSFDTLAEQRAWPRADFATWVTGYQGTTSLCIRVPPDRATGGHMIRLPLDLTRYRGCRLLVECMAKADKVSKPPASYLGIKCMLHYQSKTAGPFWQNQNEVYGTFDWRRLQFAAPIAPDATDGEIDLGLQDSAGTVWFDAVKITVFKRPLTRPKPPTNPPPAFRGHDLPRLRGVMSPNVFRDDDLRVLGTEWKANVIRWQITRIGSGMVGASSTAVTRRITGRLKSRPTARGFCWTGLARTCGRPRIDARSNTPADRDDSWYLNRHVEHRRIT